MSRPGATSAEGEVSSSDADPVPILRVTTGDPSEEELAALVAVVAVRLSAAGLDATPPVAFRSEWGAHSRKLRGIHRQGPGAWRVSGWPR